MQISQTRTTQTGARSHIRWMQIWTAEKRIRGRQVEMNKETTLKGFFQLDWGGFFHMHRGIVQFLRFYIQHRAILLITPNCIFHVDWDCREHEKSQNCVILIPQSNLQFWPQYPHQPKTRTASFHPFWKTCHYGMSRLLEFTNSRDRKFMLAIVNIILE